MFNSRFIVLPPAKQRNRMARVSRAMWHDSRALLSEFRRPMLAFVLAVIIGGVIYGQLHARRYPDKPIALVDRPYVMLQLMILETPPYYDETPPHLELIIFWYALPAIGIYVIGQGAVDFVRLFFNRNERRTAWEMAVASTYRNHVILVGVGHVGLRVARTLYQMGFEIVAIDVTIDDEADEELREMTIPVVLDDARHTTALRTSGLEHARALIVCTSDDHNNLEITMRARDMNPEIRIVTRMWDNHFAGQLKRLLNVQVMSASDLAAPAFAGSAVGLDIAQTMQVGGQDFSMIQLEVESGSFMDAKTIDDIQEDEGIDI
ncbi:MAG: potassium channel family protein, partial [Aggregatilineales bacterium]